MCVGGGVPCIWISSHGLNLPWFGAEELRKRRRLIIILVSFASLWLGGESSWTQCQWYLQPQVCTYGWNQRTRTVKHPLVQTLCEALTGPATRPSLSVSQEEPVVSFTSTVEVIYSQLAYPAEGSSFDSWWLSGLLYWNYVLNVIFSYSFSYYSLFHWCF